LELPGWEVRPQTPKSSFQEGVEFSEFADGGANLRNHVKRRRVRSGAIS